MATQTADSSEDDDVDFGEDETSIDVHHSEDDDAEFEDCTDGACCSKSACTFAADLAYHVVRDLSKLDKDEFSRYYDAAAEAATENPVRTTGPNTKTAQFCALALAKCEVEHIRRSLEAFEKKHNTEL